MVRGEMGIQENKDEFRIKYYNVICEVNIEKA